MSRIGNLPIQIPAGATITVEDQTVKAKGPKGEMTQAIDPAITVKQEDGQLVFERATEQKKHKSMHGLYRALVNNMIEGVTNGYTKELELVGVGYKAALKGKNVLELNLGYSHDIYFQVPGELTVETETVKGKNPIIKLSGFDKQLIGQVAAKLRELRKVEPYKGKGVRFVGEQIRTKAGKTASK